VQSGASLQSFRTPGSKVFPALENFNFHVEKRFDEVKELQCWRMIGDRLMHLISSKAC